MALLQQFLDLILHLDRHLIELIMRYDIWIYAILFAVIFAETGLVVTPFLPGDSLLFALGALTAVDTSGTLHLGWMTALLIFAAIAGNTANYFIGRAIGQRAFAGNGRFLRREYLQRTEDFFTRHGGMAIVLSRFVPIIRTFAPFVAGVSRMHWGRFQLYNIGGGAGWVALFMVAGFLFGNLPLVKNNFGLVTILIIIVSLAPIALVLWRDRGRESRA